MKAYGTVAALATLIFAPVALAQTQAPTPSSPAVQQPAAPLPGDTAPVPAQSPSTIQAPTPVPPAPDAPVPPVVTTPAPAPAPAVEVAPAPVAAPATVSPVPATPPSPPPVTAPRAQTTIGEGTPSQSLPPPRSDHDPQPAVAAPVLPTTGVTKQAGVGGTQAYGRAGVLELGGSGGFSAASNYRRVEVSPSIGLFVMDNVELSLLTAFNYFDVGASGDNMSADATELKALIEPSFHIPFSQTVFGFLGFGAGVNYITGQSAGFALQPRLGANFLIGRSGILTPAFTVAYSTVEAVRTPAGTLLAIQTSVGMNIGYTVMW